MAKTQPRGTQILDGTIARADLDTSTVGQAVTTKIIAGTNITITQTGVDAGTGDVTVNASASSSIGIIGVTIDGGASVITTGSKGYISIPFPATINSVTLLADQAGSIVIDIKKSTYTAFPTTSSIVASAAPTLSSAQKSQDTTLTGWTTAVAANDVFEFSVTSATTVTRVNLTLKVTKT